MRPVLLSVSQGGRSVNASICKPQDLAALDLGHGTEIICFNCQRHAPSPIRARTINTLLDTNKTLEQDTFDALHTKGAQE